MIGARKETMTLWALPATLRRQGGGKRAKKIKSILPHYYSWAVTRAIPPHAADSGRTSSLNLASYSDEREKMIYI